MTLSLSNRLDDDFAYRILCGDVLNSLQRSPKVLPSRWFYHERGSKLFDEILRLPEYYPTRAETQILRAESPAIAELTGADTLVELGSGTSEKTKLLLDALQKAGTLRRFVPFDVVMFHAAGTAIQQSYPSVEVSAVCGDFEQHLAAIPGGVRSLFVFLGSVEFAAGEEIITEVSCKFHPDRVAAELVAAGLLPLRWWTDTEGDFGVSLASIKTDRRQ